ncbi:hypothetical protein O0I10_009378 [Lichtheimia ornata]|uniref:Uncharacterized protein n=1 Tax=Lichtheimia ornata TaxID=688661 RepID=A0AAD7XYS4_9FUNG|nr:uncharacterized protein O0I10_009378 [Lichtheimia ornata]KAJ8654982.1 hypothetical protein O0I10_009378 [Lichtheimia ornata]
MIEKRAPIQNGSIRKRTPHRPASVPSDIYISNKSIPAVVIKRVRQLMVNERYHKVTLHGLGASVVRTISIAQRVQGALHNQVDLRPTTTSVTLVDDIIPDDMDKDLDSQKRMSSAIHIDLIAKPGLETLQQRVPPIASKPSRKQRTK